jgi:hypothetical protein
MKKQILTLLLIGLSATLQASTYNRTFPTSSTTRNDDYNFWDSNFSIQALGGAVQYSNLEFKMPDAESSTEADLSIIPQIGGVWSTLPKGNGTFQLGLEATLLFGFRADDLNYIVAGGHGLHVSVDLSMWMVDVAGGAYLNCFLGKNRNVRLYLAGGPLLIYSDYNADRDYSDDTMENEEQSESAFGIGAYARTGFEFRVYEYGMLGLGLRANWANLDFTDIGGSSDISGIAGYITFTAGL